MREYIRRDVVLQHQLTIKALCIATTRAGTNARRAGDNATTGNDATMNTYMATATRTRWMRCLERTNRTTTTANDNGNGDKHTTGHGQHPQMRELWFVPQGR